MKIQIIIASHKSCFLPSDSSMYLPLQVGAEGKRPLEVLSDHSVLDPSGKYTGQKQFERDDTGDQISKKNPFYCELTGAYWAWKNLDADVIGLVHYRRYFTVMPKSYRATHSWEDSVLTEAELRSILCSYASALYGNMENTKEREKIAGEINESKATDDPTTNQEEALHQLLQNGLLIVPKKRKYYIETLYSHYSHTLDGQHLDLCRQILVEKMPEYLDDFDLVMKQNWGYMWNMMIASRAVYDKYMTWLFAILEELEKRIRLDGLSPFEQRLFGRVSEILFNVWIHHEMDSMKLRTSGNTQDTSDSANATYQGQKACDAASLPVREQKPSVFSNSRLLLLEFPVLHTQAENWPLKIRSFLAAKLFGKKYKASF